VTGRAKAAAAAAMVMNFFMVRLSLLRWSNERLASGDL
jgi:hypothetical protein